jgi:prepilin-type N-terminal cleavage/methylation domain-containing protein
MQLRRARRDESGYTLTELLVTITITAIIGVVISQAFLLTLKLGRETTARNKFATDTTFLINAFSDDVANATSQPTGVTVTANAAATSRPTGTSDRVSSFGTFPLPGGQSATYKATITKAGQPTTPLYATVWTAMITRELDPGGGAPIATSTMLKAYCLRAATNIFSVPSTPDPGYAVDIRLVPQPKESERTISFRGDRRTLTPPT